MAVLVTDPFLEGRLKADRAESGGDRFDEVWEGVYQMAPLPNDDHQEIQTNFVTMLRDALGWDSPAKVRAGVNVSDRDEDWQFNYRGPDVVVYLPGNPAKNFGSHWQGGPDFLVEILSPKDRTREKLSFYAGVGVREILLVDRDPWALELYELAESPKEMRLVGAASIDGGSKLVSRVLPLAFQLISATPRPRIEVARTTPPLPDEIGARLRWLI